MIPGPYDPDDPISRPDGDAGDTGAVGEPAQGGSAALDRAVHEFVEELRRRGPQGADGMG
jgi:hypothetical protein